MKLILFYSEILFEVRNKSCKVYEDDLIKIDE